ncbi:MAG: SUMF1/EgtB/PvdO family nonheme iron enzyme [Planctomycetota bacterium]
MSVLENENERFQATTSQIKKQVNSLSSELVKIRSSIKTFESQQADSINSLKRALESVERGSSNVAQGTESQRQNADKKEVEGIRDEYQAILDRQEKEAKKREQRFEELEHKFKRHVLNFEKLNGKPLDQTHLNVNTLPKVTDVEYSQTGVFLTDNDDEMEYWWRLPGDKKLLGKLTSGHTIEVNGESPQSIVVVGFSGQDQRTQATHIELTQGFKKPYKNFLGMYFRYAPLLPFSERKLTGDATFEGNAKLKKSFYLGVTEVTQDQWYRMMKTRPWRRSPFNIANSPNQPATHISWVEANQFCERLTAFSEREKKVYRLPTVVEWHYACKAGRDTVYSFGNDKSRLDEFCWVPSAVNNWALSDVGKLKPNPWGFLDMYGNAGEWCAESFSIDLKSQKYVKKNSTGNKLRLGENPDSLVGFGHGNMFWGDAREGFRVLLEEN